MAHKKGRISTNYIVCDRLPGAGSLSLSQVDPFALEITGDM